MKINKTNQALVIRFLGKTTPWLPTVVAIGAALCLSAVPLYAQESAAGAGQAPETKDKSRKASLSLWGGYTPLLASGGEQLDTICSDYELDNENCQHTLGGIAGGLDLYAGDVFQFGLGLQYLALSDLSLSGSETITLPGGGTETVETSLDLKAQYLPVLAQIRIYPRYFYVGFGIGAAFNLTQYEATFQDQDASGNRFDDPSGLFMQLSVGVSIPLGDRVSIDVFCKGSMLTVFYEGTTTSDGSSTVTDYETVSAYGVTPGAALSFHF